MSFSSLDQAALWAAADFFLFAELEARDEAGLFLALLDLFVGGSNDEARAFRFTPRLPRLEGGSDGKTTVPAFFLFK